MSDSTPNPREMIERRLVAIEEQIQTLIGLIFENVTDEPEPNDGSSS